MPQYISSRQNQTLIEACALSEKKGREKQHCFRFDGKKLFVEAIACGLTIEKVFIREDSADALLTELENTVFPSGGKAIELLEAENRIIVLSGSAFDKICEEKSPEGIITIAKHIDKLHKIATINNIVQAPDLLPYADRSKGAPRIMALESVRDPGNLGTVIRSAAALGIDMLLLSSDCADIYNPKTVRAAMGALFTRKILRTPELAVLLQELSHRGYRTVAAALTDTALPADEIGLSRFDCVVIGNEGHGLSDGVLSACDASAILPMQRGPGIESLNASVAASIFMWLCR